MKDIKERTWECGDHWHAAVVVDGEIKLEVTGDTEAEALINLDTAMLIDILTLMGASLPELREIEKSSPTRRLDPSLN